MELPKSLSTVTGFSKLLALFLFILLPFVGFYIGMQYEQEITGATELTYYQRLAKECRSKQNSDCCLSSVETMKKNNYSVDSDKTCPEGYKWNKMLCADSYAWCEPVSESSDSAKIPEESPANTRLDYSEGVCNLDSNCEWAGEACGGGHGVCTNDPQKYEGM